MKAKKSTKQAPKQIKAVSGNNVVLESGDKFLVPTITQLRKKYGALCDGMECPRTRLEHAKKALSMGCTVTVDCDGLIGIPGWDWNAKLPVSLSSVKGLNKSVKTQALKMMADQGFMGKEPQSSKGLVDDAVKKLYA